MARNKMSTHFSIVACSLEIPLKNEWRGSMRLAQSQILLR